MSKSCSCFIRFTYRILNTASIRKIDIEPRKYIVHTTSMGDFSGFSLFGGGVGGGYVSSDNDGRYVICKDKDPADFSTMEAWIDKMNK